MVVVLVLEYQAARPQLLLCSSCRRAACADTACVLMAVWLCDCLCVFVQERVLQLETQLRQRDGDIQEALAAASAGAGRDKQVCVTRKACFLSLQQTNPNCLNPSPHSLQPVRLLWAVWAGWLQGCRWRCLALCDTCGCGLVPG